MSSTRITLVLTLFFTFYLAFPSSYIYAQSSAWTTKTYSGDGNWEWVLYSAGRYTTPPGGGLYHMVADSNEWKSQTFDVGLFSPSIDLGGYPSVTIQYARDFQDYIGCGLGEVRVYSGGVHEITLWSLSIDDPAGGLIDSHSFSTSGFTESGNTQFEFYYTTDALSDCWGFGLDDVTVSSGITIFHEDFEEDPFGPAPTSTPYISPTPTTSPTPLPVPVGSLTNILIYCFLSMSMLFIWGSRRVESNHVY